MIISLAGMPGSGKSSVGRELAALLGCAFIDLDDRIEALQGRSIPEIFREKGEAHFRTVELEALKDVLASHQQPQQSRTGTEGTTGMTGTTRIAGTANTTGGATGTTEMAGLAEAARTTEAAGTTVMADTAAMANAAGSITGRPTLVLSLGGGTPTVPECAGLISRSTFCVYLKTSPRTLAERLAGEDIASRPVLCNGNTASGQANCGEYIAPRPMSGDGEQQLFPDCCPDSGCQISRQDNSGRHNSGCPTGGELQSRLASLLASREGIYEKAARLTVETDGLNVKEVAALAAGRLALALALANNR